MKRPSFSKRRVQRVDDLLAAFHRRGLDISDMMDLIEMMESELRWRRTNQIVFG